MRTKLALAGLVAGAASFLAPLSPASAVCQQPLIILGDGGGGEPQCAPCTEEEVYQEARHATSAGEKYLPQSMFMCVQ